MNRVGVFVANRYGKFLEKGKRGDPIEKERSSEGDIERREMGISFGERNDRAERDRAGEESEMVKVGTRRGNCEEEKVGEIGGDDGVRAQEGEGREARIMR